MILKIFGGTALAAGILLNVQLISESSDYRTPLNYLKSIAYANSENGDGDGCVPVEIIYQELFGYYTNYCCQSVYHTYIDRYYCEVGENCFCPGRTQTETWTYVGENCCA